MEGSPHGHPRDVALLNGLVPALLVAGLPITVNAAARALGVQPAAFYPMPSGAFQADFEVPEPSSWRVWPEAGHAIWFGGSASTASPPVTWNWQRRQVDLSSAVQALGARGLWLQDGAIKADGAWGEPLPSAVALGRLTPHVTGLAGTWSNADGRAIRAAIFRASEVWAETPALAEHLLFSILSPADTGSVVPDP